MTDTSPPGAARSGPWTVHICVTAACTRCGHVPVDEDTGLTPHFASPEQARQELPRDWGWHVTARPALADEDELLCPACATAAGGTANPPPPAPDAGADQGPGAAPWREDPGQLRGGLPANTGCLPATGEERR
jgi:hypothetical protein